MLIINPKKIISLKINKKNYKTRKISESTMCNLQFTMHIANIMRKVCKYNKHYKIINFQVDNVQCICTLYIYAIRG